MESFANGTSRRRSFSDCISWDTEVIKVPSLAALRQETRRALRIADEATNVAQEALEELSVLKTCLTEAGLLQQGKLLSAMHRRRFDRLWKSSDFATTATFEDLGRDPLSRCSSFLRGVESERLRITCDTIRSKVPQRDAAVFVISGVGTFSGAADMAGKLFKSTECLQLVPNSKWEVLPQNLHIHRVGAACAVLDGMIYVAGGGGFNGANNLKSAERFDPENRRGWEILPEMYTGRFGCSAAAVSGRIVVCNGNDGANKLSCSEYLDTRSCTWTSLPDMVSCRIGAASVNLDGKVYVIGGSDQDGTLDSVEYLDMRVQPHRKNHTWSWAPSMNHARFGCRGTVVKGCIVVAGGVEKADDLDNLASLEMYDPRNDAWEMMTPMSTPRFAPCVVGAQGLLLVFGGAEKGHMFVCGQRLDTAEIWNGSAWKTLPSMMFPRGAAVAAAAFPPPPSWL